MLNKKEKLLQTVFLNNILSSTSLILSLLPGSFNSSSSITERLAPKCSLSTFCTSAGTPGFGTVSVRRSEIFF